MSKIERRIVEKWLEGMERWANDRIQGGDLDMDDVLYRTRDCATALLTMWFEKVKK